jgi:hypothetical protein
MSFRFTGLVPAIALLVAGVAHAQPASTGGGGSMAYPDSLPSGQIRSAAPTARDVGNMQYPAPSGGVTTSVPAPTPLLRRGRPAPAAPTPPPSAAGRAAASEMALQPSTAPIPYTDFAPAPAAMGHGTMMHHKMPVHHAAAHPHPHAATPAPATPATATPAPTTPAPAK